MSGLQTQWNKFVTKYGPASGAFLQSWEWGEFQEKVNRQIIRFVLINKDWRQVQPDDQESGIKNQEFGGVMQIIKMSLSLGKSYLYIPRGPIFANQESRIKNQEKEFLNLLSRFAKQEKAIFVKIELSVEQKLFDELNLQPTTYNLQPTSIQPQTTLILNLEKSEEDLLAAMHEKTRYNIRLAEKKGVRVRWSEAINSDASTLGGLRQSSSQGTGAEYNTSANKKINSDAAPFVSADRQSSSRGTGAQDLESFWKLAQKTAKRDRFNYHPKEYYRQMLFFGSQNTVEVRPPSSATLASTSRSDLNVKLIIAEKYGETLAANIVNFFGDTVTYLHGASNYARRELMAPHLLQWRAIQEAKRLGFKYYDFWGIAPISNFGFRISDLKHKWAGITRFKIGFGGEQINHAPALDLIVNNFWYKLYRLAKKLRP